MTNEIKCLSCGDALATHECEECDGEDADCNAKDHCGYYGSD